jgi:hypothetical protein
MASSKQADFLRALYQDWTDRMVAGQGEGPGGEDHSVSGSRRAACLPRAVRPRTRGDEELGRIAAWYENL